MRVQRRWKEHARGDISCISKALRKYGVDAFDFDVIDETDEDHVQELEVAYIQAYNSVAPNGYNLLEAGAGNCGHHPETRAKMSRAARGRRATAETKSKMSVAQKGRVVTELTRQKVSRANLDSINPTARAVARYDRQGTYVRSFTSSWKAADRDRSLAQRITKACTGGRLVKDHQYRFDIGRPAALPPHRHANLRRRKVLQLREGALVDTHDSIAEAAEKIGVKGCSISAVLCGRAPSCRGCSWKYADGGVPAKRTRKV